MKVRVNRPANPVLLGLLDGHPEVELVDPEISGSILFLEKDGWKRELGWGDFEGAEERGLMELIDNNPVVCADKVSVPGVEGTLACIGLGPLLRAGLVLKEPVLYLSFAVDDPEDLSWQIAAMGWNEGVTVGVEENDMGSVRAMNAMVEIPLMDDYGVLDELFEECFGQSLYVREAGEAEWDTRLVAGEPFAVYRLRISAGEETALLNVQVMADVNGKLGAAQVVHALNIMFGFEECLGLV